MKIRRIPKAIGLAVLTTTLAFGVTQTFGFPQGYSIGLNFGADEFPDSSGTLTGAGTLAATDVAGVPPVAQAHWNNLLALSGTGSALVADNSGASVNTTAAVDWTSNNTWATTGRGEENNGFPTNTPNYKLMIGYLDTGDPSTTTINISGLPAALTTGYDVYVYLLGGTGGNRGGGYHITDAAGATLRDYLIGDAPVNPTSFVRDLGLSHNDKGNYLVFRGLTAASIKIEATTEAPYGMVRAPINAIQLVAATLDKTPPTVPANFAAAETGAAHINLKWDAATDASGTVIYEIERDSASLAKTADITYADFGLKATSTHSYRIRASDDSANVSAWSAPLSVTTVAETPFDGYLKFEVWTGMDAGTAITLLTDWIAAGKSPNFISYTPAFDSRPIYTDDTHEQYGARISGWLTPTDSGNYTFFLRSDDASQLWLSTDETEAKLALIAEDIGCCSAFLEPDPNQGAAWHDNGAGMGQTTLTPISLVGGKKYFVSLLYKEGGGGDYGQVAWRKAGDTTPAASLVPIPGIYLSSLVDAVGASVAITTQPSNATANEGTTSTFTVAATAQSPYATNPGYQWFKNSTLIPGATSASYTTPEVSIAGDNGAKFKATVSVPGATATSSEVTLTVVKDTTPPKITRAGAGSVQAVTVIFDEPVDKTSAETASNYTISGGITVSKAVLEGSSSNVVRLTTSSMTVNSPYTVTVGGVKDRYNNAVPAGTQASFTAKVVTYGELILSDKPIAFYRFEETSGQVAKNSGTLGVSADGLWKTGPGPTDSSPADVSPGEGPRPSEFLGFDPANRSAKMTGPDGQQWVDAQKPLLNNLKAFSLEYWVKPANRDTDPGAFGTRIGLVGQNDAVEYGFINQTTVQIWSSGGGSLDTPYSFPDGEWHHVATIADGKSIKNYYDGKLVGTGGSVTSSYGSSTFNVHIGGGGVYDATGNFFTGEFDEVAIFDKAIPADRIAAHYKAGKEGGELPAEEGAKFTGIQVSGGNVTITWTGGGTLQQSATVQTGYTDVAGAASPYSTSASGAVTFYRVRQ